MIQVLGLELYIEITGCGAMFYFLYANSFIRSRFVVPWEFYHNCFLSIFILFKYGYFTLYEAILNKNDKGRCKLRWLKSIKSPNPKIPYKWKTLTLKIDDV